MHHFDILKATNFVVFAAPVLALAHSVPFVPETAHGLAPASGSRAVSEVAAVLALVVQLVASSLAPQAAAAAAGKLTGPPFRHLPLAEAAPEQGASDCRSSKRWKLPRSLRPPLRPPR